MSSGGRSGLRASALALVAVLGGDGCKGATSREPSADPPPPRAASNRNAAIEPNSATGSVVEEEAPDDGVEGDGDMPLAPLLGSTAMKAIARGALADEAARELAAMRASTYVHRTHVDEAAGVFDYDCSGFVVHLLRKAAAHALEPMRGRASGRPLARDFVALLEEANEAAIAPWRALRSVSEIARGDVIAWRKPVEVVSRNTGHVMIVEGPPTLRGQGEWVVPIVDSTAAPHGKSDSRFARKATGLGRGTIVLLVDAAGAPRGYRWSEWVGSHPHATTTSLGRLGPTTK